MTEKSWLNWNLLKNVSLIICAHVSMTEKSWLNWNIAIDSQLQIAVLPVSMTEKSWLNWNFPIRVMSGNVIASPWLKSRGSIETDSGCCTNHTIDGVSPWLKSRGSIETKTSGRISRWCAGDVSMTEKSWLNWNMLNEMKKHELVSQSPWLKSRGSIETFHNSPSLFTFFGLHDWKVVAQLKR